MNTLKKFFAALILLIFASMACTPAALAQTGTLGTENPYLYCSFYNANGDAVDGNALTSGEYRVDIILSGMQTAAVMQITAEADLSSSSALKSLSVLSTYDETDSSFKLAAADFITDELLSIILNSRNVDSCSAIDSNGTVMASLSASIECEGTIDFIDYFNFSTDPDLTFFEADYGDGDDCYALSQGEDVICTVYPMTADVTPEFNNNNNIIISGTVLISQDENGTAGTFGAREINFKVNGEYVKDENGNNAVTSSVAGHYGEFSITVPKGTTEITVTGASTIDRTVTLSGTADISNASIPIVFCDYNKDSRVTGTDTGMIKQALNGTAVVYDLNIDNKVTATDVGLYAILVNKPIQYSSISLDN